MAFTLRHFADPHPLVRREYSSTARHVCDLCGSNLAGHIAYRCESCDLDIHEACANYFRQTISFAHPGHDLVLTRIPNTHSCDLCPENCDPGRFLYRCAPCDLDVHPVCTMFPQVIRSSLHIHDLHMVTDAGNNCDACREALPVWHYSCGLCAFKLHIACAGARAGAGAGVGRGGAGNGGSRSTVGGGGGGVGAPVSGAVVGGGGVGAPVGGAVVGGGGGALVGVGGSSGAGSARPGGGNNRVARYLLRQSFRLAIDLATDGMAAGVIDALDDDDDVDA